VHGRFVKPFKRPFALNYPLVPTILCAACQDKILCGIIIGSLHGFSAVSHQFFIRPDTSIASIFLCVGTLLSVPLL